MPLSLRITVHQKDYIFQILTEKPSLQPSLEILMDEKIYTFKRQGHHWVFQNLSEEEVDTSVFQAIEKALALRFRISTSFDL